MNFSVHDEVRITAVSSQFMGLEGSVVAVGYSDDYLIQLPLGLSWFFWNELELADPEAATEKVNHPEHYTWLRCGVEAIDITSNFGFVRGNALKYLMRADHKGKRLEDLKKARWYIDYEIKQLEKEDGK